MGKSSSPPPAPDPRVVAEAQAGQNADAARLTAKLNRPTINTPFGTQTWTDMGGDNWASNVNLTPNQQTLFNQQEKLSLGLGDIANNSLGGVNSALSQPFSLSGAMDTLSSVTEPKYNRDEDALRTRLANSGFRQGSEGFDQSMQDFQVAKEKGRAATAQQAFELASALRSQPISELNSLRTGAQPNIPQMSGSPNVAVNPADITSPFANQYQGQLAGFNAGVANDNATTGALATAAMVAAMMF